MADQEPKIGDIVLFNDLDDGTKGIGTIIEIDDPVMDVWPYYIHKGDGYRTYLGRHEFRILTPKEYEVAKILYGTKSDEV